MILRQSFGTEKLNLKKIKIKFDNEKINKEKMFKSISTALEKKMMVKVSFVIGFPHESARHLWANVPILSRLAFLGTHSVAIIPFSPYPGSELFESLKGKEKLMINDNYFHNLLRYCGLSAPLSYSDRISNKELAVFSFGFLALFYSLSFLFRPNRFANV